MIVGRVASKNPHEVSFTENDDLVEALPADRSDQTLAVRILPRRGGGSEYFLDAHRLDAPDEAVTEDTVAVPQEVPGRGPACGVRRAPPY